MLLCGFEKFDNFYVRIDILERLFLMIFNSGEKNDKNKKIIPEMLNLLGCTKENFVKLLQKMNYKTYIKEDDIYFKYIQFKKNFKNKEIKKDLSNSPFGVLSQLNIK